MSTIDSRKLDELCINTIRLLSADAVQRAESGHPGLPMGAAPMAYVLWQRHLRHNPEDPDWPNRDRFVLSAGHGSMLLYSLLYLTGYDLTMDDISSFRQWESRTPGHVEKLLTPGAEVTAGPLGQGAANAVGLAIAERALAAYFNRPGHEIVNHFTYALLSDGDMMEGVCAEAASLAGHLGLAKLIYLYDSNDTSLDGPTSMAFTEDTAMRFEAYGWHVQRVEDGNRDLDAIHAAVTAAKREIGRPSLIIVHTTIGFGAPHRQGTYQAHGSPLGEQELKLAKKAFGWDPENYFHIPQDALENFRTAVYRGRIAQDEWEGRLQVYEQEYPELAVEWNRSLAGALPAKWDENLPSWQPGENVATRSAAGEVLNAIAAKHPFLIGGDADLSSSTKTAIKDSEAFDGRDGGGRNIHFGVREHAMGGIANGICYHGGLRPFAATFLVFSDYMRPSVRLAAISRLPVVFVWTHDSIGLGEDGPTHQPVEHISSLRAMPNIHLVRPCDANEAAEAWRYALLRKEGPTGLILTRQKLPVLEGTARAARVGLPRGAYVLSEAQGGPPEAIVIATGSEVCAALDAQKILAGRGIRARVVSMPCWEAFEQQHADYKEAVLPASITARASVEAGSTFGWHRWVGDRGVAIGLDRFGMSAPGEVNMEKLGFTGENIARVVGEVVGREVHQAV